MNGITTDWLLQEIKRLEALEGPAMLRLAEAKRTYQNAQRELLEAQGEAESLITCLTEWQWQMANMEAKKSAEGS